MYFNVAALSIGLGLTTALDTLAPQAVGAQKEELLSVYLQRGAVVLTVAFLILLIPALFCGEILMILGQPPKVARRAGVYVRWMLPSLPCYWGFELLRKVFHAFAVVEPLVIIGAGSTLIHCVLAYYFVRGDMALPEHEKNFKGTGYVGAALARSISMFAAFLALIGYAIGTGFTKRFWTGLTSFKTILHRPDLVEFLKLGGAGCAAICFEWWAFECLSIFSGLLPRRPDVFIGAHAVLFNLAALFYMILSGCASAASVRTGLALGSDRPDRAKVAMGVALIAAVSVGVMNAAIIYACRDSLPKLFDKDSAVRKVAAGAMPALAIYQIFDAFNAVAGGVMRGAGRQTTPAMIMLVAYYVFGIPASVVFAFPLKLRLVGLWLGITFGLTIASGLFAMNLSCLVDWQQLSKEAIQRTEHQGNGVHHHDDLPISSSPGTTTPLSGGLLDDHDPSSTPGDLTDDADELDTLDLDSEHSTSRVSGYSTVTDDFESPAPAKDRLFPRVDNYRPLLDRSAQEEHKSKRRSLRQHARLDGDAFDDDGQA